MEGARDVREVHGAARPEYEPLRDLLRDGISDDGECGCALALYVEGELVCDLWGGESAPGQPWKEDTLALAYSVGKGMLSLCAQLLVHRGELDVGRPVADYWPEFAQEGKDRITVRQLLNHTAGMLTFPRYWEWIGPDGSGIDDWEMMVTRLAAAPPALPPGSETRYHAVTFGYLVGEVVRRVTGVSPGRFFASEVAAPLRLQATIGTPRTLHGRVAQLLPQPRVDPATPEAAAVTEAFRASREAILAGDAYAPAALAFCSPVFLHPDIGVEQLPRWTSDVFNRTEIREAEIPASNPVVDARSLARMYAALADGGCLDGVELVSPEVVAAWSAPTPDAAPSAIATFGLGYHTVSSDARPSGLPRCGFGHGGAGGNLAFADPDLRLGFAYVKNRYLDGAVLRRVVDATYECLGAR